MLATNYNLCHKIQSRANLGFATAFNQNILEVCMTDVEYSSLLWLSKGKYTIVDNEDYDWLSQWKWLYHGKGYAKRNDRSSGVQRFVSMHRVIMQAPEGLPTDHIDGNRLDNRKANLRVCSHAENSRNRNMMPTNTTGFKGIVLDKRYKKWRAQIGFDGKIYYSGLYKTPIKAAKAYDKLARKLHGKFARTNKSLGLV